MDIEVTSKVKRIIRDSVEICYILTTSNKLTKSAMSTRSRIRDCIVQRVSQTSKSQPRVRDPVFPETAVENYVARFNYKCQRHAVCSNFPNGLHRLWSAATLSSRLTFKMIKTRLCSYTPWSTSSITSFLFFFFSSWLIYRFSCIPRGVSSKWIWRENALVDKVSRKIEHEIIRETARSELIQQRNGASSGRRKAAKEKKKFSLGGLLGVVTLSSVKSFRVPTGRCLERPFPQIFCRRGVVLRGNNRGRATAATRWEKNEDRLRERKTEKTDGTAEPAFLCNESKTRGRRTHGSS